MEKNPEEPVKWGLTKAEEFLESARKNLNEDRLYPAAEEIFRVVETTLEALLYHHGIKKIEYPGTRKKFTGRLALQFLIRDNLLKSARPRITKEEYNRYLALASDLHLAGYTQSRNFDKEELKNDFIFAEDLLIKARSITKIMGHTDG